MPQAHEFDLSGRLLLDRFRVRERLDRGGMGSVWLADDLKFGLPAVIKIPSVALLDEPGFRERFELEVKSLTRLVHPNIVRVHDFGVVDDVPFMVMQFLAGGSLKQSFEKGPRKQDAETVLGWLEPIADALDYMHGKQMIHRDIKPANILFDDADHAHLADFGIAKSLASTDTGLTRTGASPGTPQYVPPESYDGVDLAPPADQYSLALIVYEALTGVQAHGGKSLNEVLGKKLKPLPPIVELAPELSPTLNGVVMRALQREPGKRFASCGTFVEAFERALRSHADNEAQETVSRSAENGIRTERQAQPRERPEPRSHVRSAPAAARRTVVVRAIAAVLLAAAAFGAWKLWAGRPYDAMPAADSSEHASSEPPAPKDTTAPALLGTTLIGEGTPHRSEESTIAGTLTFDEPVRLSGAALRTPDMEYATTKSVELALLPVDRAEPEAEPFVLTATDAAGNTVPASVKVALYCGAKRVASFVDRRPRVSAEWASAPVARKRDLTTLFQGDAEKWEAEVAKDELLLAAEKQQLITNADWATQRTLMKSSLQSLREVTVTLESPVTGVPTNQTAVQVKGRVDPDDVTALKLWFDGTPEKTFAVKSGAVDRTVPLPKRTDGSVADGDYVLNIATESGTIIDQPHVLVDRTPPMATLARVLGEPPFRVEAATFEVEFAFSEPVELILVSKNESLVPIGTTAITLQLELPASTAADPAPATIVLMAMDAAMNRSPVSVPIDLFSARARVEWRQTQRPSVTIGTAVADPVAAVEALDQWQKAVRADHYLNADEKRSLADSAELSRWRDDLELQTRAAVENKFGPVKLDGFTTKGKNAQGKFEYLHDATGLLFVYLEGGTFTMGSHTNEADRRDDEIPHSVTLSPFLIAKYEVTQAIWQKVMGSNPSKFSDDARRPVEQVSWNDAVAFCGKIGANLPTEAQWEFACRAASTGPHAGSLDDFAWYGERHDRTTHSVGTKKPNAWGLHDMHGNVWEWCADWYDVYTLTPVGDTTSEDPSGPASGSARVLRGGSCWDDAGWCRSAFRDWNDPSLRWFSAGFRVALPAAPVPR